jgi:hypothetical protein
MSIVLYNYDLKFMIDGILTLQIIIHYWIIDNDSTTVSVVVVVLS